METASSLYIVPEEQEKKNGKALELALWTILLAAINLSLLSGHIPEPFVFDLQKVKAGQWWRIVTYPFAHVSIYHLIMDASAFLMLYAGLEEKRISRRMVYIAGCGIGGLLLALPFSRIVGIVGLSGLSGIAHGLMAVTALELMKRHKKETALFGTGVVLLAIVSLKSILEFCTGDVVFASLHMGSIGTPVVEAHLGGVMGGIGSFVIMNRGRRRQPVHGENRRRK